MRKGIIIAGYYGANNTGDEAILTGMIQALGDKGITDITVLSRNPEATSKQHGVKSIYIGRRFDGLIEIYKAMRKSKLFILGGGGLLQDYSSRVVPYWLLRVTIAILAGTPVMYYAQGVGPLNTPRAIKMVTAISNRVRRITVRDDSSYQLLSDIGVVKPNIEVTADPALAIKISSNGKELLKKAGEKEHNKRKIGIALRNWRGEEKYLPHLIRALNRLNEKNDLMFYFFPFQYGEDEGISERVLAGLGYENGFIIRGEYTPEQMAAMLKEMDGIIAMRLHALILGAISFTPSFGLVYDPKVFNFMERIEQRDNTFLIEEIEKEPEQLEEKLLAWFEQNRQIKEQIKQPVQKMIDLSLRNADIAYQIMTNK